MLLNPIIFFIPLLFFILYYGKFFLLPLSLSLFIFLIVKSLSLKLIFFFQKYLQIKIGNFISFLTVFLILFLSVFFIWKLLKFHIMLVNIKSSIYQENFMTILDKLSQNNFQNFINPIFKNLEDINIGNILGNILSFFTNFAGISSLVIVYLIFIIAEEKFFKAKIKIISQRKKTQNIIKKINTDIFNYFQIKFLTSFLTGLLTLLVLMLFQSDLTILFAFLSFFFNFIPFLGSIMSIIIPTIFSLVQFVSPSDPLFIFISLTFVQIIVGNFLEPKLIGKSLNISPLIMLIVLSVMGKIWGIVGMFLSVPFLVTLLIIFSNFDKTRILALLISEKGIK